MLACRTIVMMNSFSQQELKKKHAYLENKIKKKVPVALKKSNPVLWDEIEEMSMIKHDIKTKLDAYSRENKCWDELECREYDI